MTKTEYLQQLLDAGLTISYPNLAGSIGGMPFKDAAQILLWTQDQDQIHALENQMSVEMVRFYRHLMRTQDYQCRYVTGSKRCGNEFETFMSGTMNLAGPWFLCKTHQKLVQTDPNLLLKALIPSSPVGVGSAAG